MGDELSKPAPPDPVEGIADMLSHASALTERHRYFEAAKCYQHIMAILSQPIEEGKVDDWNMGYTNQRPLCDYDEEALNVARMGFANCAVRTGKNLREAAVACSVLLDVREDAHARFIRGWIWALLAKAGDTDALTSSERDLNEALKLEPNNANAAKILRTLLKFKETGQASPRGLQLSQQLQDEDNEWMFQYRITSESSRSSRIKSEEDLEWTPFEMENVSDILRQEDPPYPEIPEGKRVPLRIVVRCFEELFGDSINTLPSGSDSSEDDFRLDSSDDA